MSMDIHPDELPNADYVSERIMSLPLYPKMTLADARDVVEAVKTVIVRNRKKRDEKPDA